MTREFASSRYALVLALAIAASAAAGAQTLQRVTVTGFTLSADTTQPREGVPFHLFVTLRLREPVTNVENLQLPVLAGLKLLGDVRRTTSDGNGALYREVVTVDARHAGSFAIAPATFDAIDARDGKAKQYSSNALTLRIRGAGVSPVTIAAMALVAVGVALMVLGFALAVVLNRRRGASIVCEPEPPAEPPPAPVPSDPLGEARALLEREPTRAGALRARALVWRMVGAGDGETLADVTERVRDTRPKLTSLLGALERAAFTYEDDVAKGIDGALTALRAIR